MDWIRDGRPRHAERSRTARPSPANPAKNETIDRQVQGGRRLPRSASPCLDRWATACLSKDTKVSPPSSRRRCRGRQSFRSAAPPARAAPRHAAFRSQPVLRLDAKVSQQVALEDDVTFRSDGEGSHEDLHRRLLGSECKSSLGSRAYDAALANCLGGIDVTWSSILSRCSMHRSWYFKSISRNGGTSLSLMNPR